MPKVEVLKELALKCTSATKVSDVPGSTVCEVLDYIVENFAIEGGAQGPAGPQGETGPTGPAGADGLSIQSIQLTVTDGVVTGGTATMSDGTTTVPITVTTGA